MKKENRTRAITVLLVGICAVAVTAFAAQRIVNLTCDKALMGDVSIKTLRTGGDPLNGTDSTEVTATAAELNYLDVTAGTATASKALVLNSSKTVASVNSMSVTGTLTIAEGGLANSTVLSADIKDGEIVNADVNASAAIALSKLGVGTLTWTNTNATVIDGTTAVSATITVPDGAGTGTNLVMVFVDGLLKSKTP
jgi:hypothetical protein